MSHNLNHRITRISACCAYLKDQIIQSHEMLSIYKRAQQSFWTRIRRNIIDFASCGTRKTSN